MILVVSHDAGGAEIVSSYVRRTPVECLFVLGGPARAIFERKLGAVNQVELAEGIARATRLCCGTSHPADLELSAIKLARQQAKPSVAFLDHWINYRERFIRDGELTLPDAIWVGDAAAERLAKQAFPELPVTLVPNPYMRDIQEALAAAAPVEPDPDGLRVLYVCEPLSEHALRRFGDARHWGYTEDEALRFFLSRLHLMGAPVARVTVRPHPSETAEKYAWAAATIGTPVSVRSDTSLLDEIHACDLVAGCNSMAMIVGRWAGKRVTCAIPPGGSGFALPLDGIEFLATAPAPSASWRPLS